MSVQERRRWRFTMTRDGQRWTWTAVTTFDIAIAAHKEALDGSGGSGFVEPTDVMDVNPCTATPVGECHAQGCTRDTWWVGNFYCIGTARHRCLP